MWNCKDCRRKESKEVRENGNVVTMDEGEISYWWGGYICYVTRKT